MRNLLYQRGSLTFTWKDTLELCGAGWEVIAGRGQCMQRWGGRRKGGVQGNCSKVCRARINTVWEEKDEKEAGFRTWRAVRPLVGTRSTGEHARSGLQPGQARVGQSERDWAWEA